MLNSGQNNNERIFITGGEKLCGKVNISGAKNAALPLMALSLIINEDFKLLNVPDLADTRLMVKLLNDLGIKSIWKNGHVNFNGIAQKNEASYELVRQMRASILILGPLLASQGSAKVPLPGGCAIGSRPIDLHVMVMEALGANIKFDSGFIVGSVPSEGLRGGNINFPKISVGATESAIMTAVLAKGQTIISNAAQEPEIIDIVTCLNKAGANIVGEGSNTIIINGVEELKKLQHEVVADRIEAGSFAIAASITMGDIEIKNIIPKYLERFLKALENTGSKVEIYKNSINICASKRPLPYNIFTEEHPGFPTDLQAQYMTLMSIADGECEIRENIFENRFMHVPELIRMGARISVKNQTATVTGVNYLKASKVMASDLRASMCLILGGLSALGTSEVDGIYHLDRGYENLEGKLSDLGANIRRSR